ncbi:MAG: hypothetical protein H6695_07220 [Deferribacteres bacterium]|nr:hypothetical protein [Deferribacteres bacterium]
MRNLFVVLLVGFLPPLIGQTTQTLSGVYTIQQASNERFIDAHEIEKTRLQSELVKFHFVVLNQKGKLSQCDSGCSILSKIDVKE